MRNFIDSSALCSRILRGLALGCCCLTLLFGSVLTTYAAEPGEDLNLDEMEDVNHDANERTGTALDDGTSNPDSGETGQDSPESEVEVSSGQVGCTCAETLISFLSTETASDEEIIIYENLDEFEASTAFVDRYQYELLKRLEFLQYSQVIMIGLIFVLIFKKK